MDIITLLTNPPPSTIPTLTAGDETKNAILQLATILGTNPFSQQKWTDQNNSTIQKATLLPIIKPTQQINKITSKALIQTLRTTLIRLARVLKEKKTTPKINSHAEPSFKHKAANFLVDNHHYHSPIQNKSFHIYNAKFYY